MAQDQLEIMHPDGRVSFVNLDPAQGITRIGSHPENDVVIDSPDVAPFHAMLDHRQHPPYLMLLSDAGRTAVGGQGLASNNAYPLQNFDTIELNGHAMIYIEGGGAPAHAQPATTTAPMAATMPVAAIGAAAAASALAPTFSGDMPTTEAAMPSQAPQIDQYRMLTPPVERPDDIIIVRTSENNFTLDVESPANFQIEIVNGGSIVAGFHVQLQGINPEWVQITPSYVNLNEGERTTLTATITPPRHTTSYAGIHYFAIMVTSPDHPGRVSSTNGQLTINPFYEYALSEVSPRQITERYGKKYSQAAFSVVNQGNSETAFRVGAQDDQQGLNFVFKTPGQEVGLARQMELRLAPDESETITMDISTIQRKMVAARPHTYSYNVSVTPVEGDTYPRTAIGQLSKRPLIGPGTLMLIGLLMLAIAAWIYRPVIKEFDSLPTDGMIGSGEAATLTWRASYFSKLRLVSNIANPDDPAADDANTIGETIEETQGSLDVKPLETVTYTLIAENFLSKLSPRWFSDSADVAIAVGPIDPIINFNVDKEQIIIGEDQVTVTWSVDFADEVVLYTNGIPQVLDPSDFAGGSLTFTPEEDTTYTLSAKNRYTTEGDSFDETRFVRALVPTATPLPPAIIKRFNVSPNSLMLGESVTVEWSVENVESVSITPLGDNFPATGQVVFEPDAVGPLQLVLSGTNGEEAVSALANITVNPQPTATPEPGTPVVEFLTASPEEAILGSPEASNVQIGWSVTGEYTDIQLESDEFGLISGLSAQGSRSFTFTDQGEFTFKLTARNGTLEASQETMVVITAPAPAIILVDPSKSDQVGSDVGIPLTITGANFFPGAAVKLDGVNLSTTYVSTTQLQATIPSTKLGEAKEFAITVVNSENYGAGESDPAPFKLNNPIPSINDLITDTPAGLVPDSTTVNSGDMILTINGTNLLPITEIFWNDVILANPTYISDTQLRVTVKNDLLQTAGSVLVSLSNPQPGGGSSNVEFFTIEHLVPEVSVVSPNSTTMGGPPVKITITGQNFVPTTGTGPYTTFYIGDLGGRNKHPIPSGSLSCPDHTTCDIVVNDAALFGAGLKYISASNPTPGGGVSTTEIPFTVYKANTTVTVGTSATSGYVYGSPIDLVALVEPVVDTPTDPTLSSRVWRTGSVLFEVNNVAIGWANIDPTTPGSATLSLPGGLLNVIGNTNITATYYGDDNFNASPESSAYVQVVNQAQTQVTITSTNAWTHGVWFSTYRYLHLTVTADITTTNSSTPVTSGNATLSFKRANGSTYTSGPVAVSNGKVSIFIHYYYNNANWWERPDLSQPVTITYGGNSYFAGSSGSSNATNEPADTEISAITVSPASGPYTYGNAITITATAIVSDSSPVEHPGAGRIHFFSNGVEIGDAATDSNGQASITSPDALLAVGDNLLTAQYVPDAGNTNDKTSDATVTKLITINNKYGPVTITADAPVNNGDGTITWTYNITGPYSIGSGGNPTGTVRFYFMSEYSCTNTYNGWTYPGYLTAQIDPSTGKASVTMAYADGDGYISSWINYLGDGNYNQRWFGSTPDGQTPPWTNTNIDTGTCP